MVLMRLICWQILGGYYIKAVINIIPYVVCVLDKEFLGLKMIGILLVEILLLVYWRVTLFEGFGIVKELFALLYIFGY